MTFLERYQRETEGFDIHSVGDGEAHFSWAPCDTCGSSLGGDRYDCTLVNTSKTVAADGRTYVSSANDSIEVESCVDCVMFAANGQLPEEEEEGT